jgi:hypothetical protein
VRNYPAAVVRSLITKPAAVVIVIIAAIDATT